MGHFCVNCGTPLGEREIEGRTMEACDGCGFVLWRDPKVVTLVIVESEDRSGIVIGRRAIEPGYGLWCLPGGFVNDDEDPRAAAARECLEEIGAEVEIAGLLGVYHIPRVAAPSMVGLAYTGRVRAGSTPVAGPEMLEVGVFGPASVPPLAFPSHHRALDDWLAASGAIPERR